MPKQSKKGLRRFKKRVVKNFKGHHLPKRSTKGRRRFKSKFVESPRPLDPYNQPRPYGEEYPVINIANRRSLLKFFLPVVKALPPDAPMLVVADVPLNFAQVANQMLGDKQGSVNNPENVALCAELEQFEREVERPGAWHPNWNTEELPPELLRRVLSQHAKFCVKRYVCVQQALARLGASERNLDAWKRN